MTPLDERLQTPPASVIAQNLVDTPDLVRVAVTGGPLNAFTWVDLTPAQVQDLICSLASAYTYARASAERMYHP